MPNSKTHKYVSITAGLGSAAFSAKEQSGTDFLIEVIGGGIGGWLTGNLPDVLEPATSSYHRSTAHSVSVSGAIVSQLGNIGKIADFCRDQGARLKENPKRVLMIPVDNNVTVRIEVSDNVGKVFNKIEEVLWILFAGLIVGAAFGYLSHVGLDCVTGKRGIPLLTKGF